jgi:exportin-T
VLEDSKRSFLASLMEVILTKLKWDENPELDDADEDDIAEFERMRKVSWPFSYTDYSCC